MRIWDFPMESPKVESRHLKGIHFNIGPTMHHLCGDCFNLMMEQFTNAAK